GGIPGHVARLARPCFRSAGFGGNTLARPRRANGEALRETMAADVDLLVVGAGACWLAAAITAHDAGVDVAIIEKLDRPGGNSALSTGSVPAAGTRFQR